MAELPLLPRMVPKLLPKNPDKMLHKQFQEEPELPVKFRIRSVKLFSFKYRDLSTVSIQFQFVYLVLSSLQNVKF